MSRLSKYLGDFLLPEKVTYLTGSGVYIPGEDYMVVRVTVQGAGGAGGEGDASGGGGGGGGGARRIAIFRIRISGVSFIVPAASSNSDGSPAVFGGLVGPGGIKGRSRTQDGGSGGYGGGLAYDAGTTQILIAPDILAGGMGGAGGQIADVLKRFAMPAGHPLHRATPYVPLLGSAETPSALHGGQGGGSAYGFGGLGGAINVNGEDSPVIGGGGGGGGVKQVSGVTTGGLGGAGEIIVEELGVF